MKRNAIILATLLTMFVFSAAARGEYVEQNIELETNLVPLVSPGFEIDGAWSYDNHRILAGFYGMNVPALLRGNGDWTQKGYGFTLKWDYFFDLVENEGLFVGPEFDYAYWTFSTLDRDVSRGQVSVGMRAGYRVSFFIEKGFFVVPWLGLDYVFNTDNIEIDGRKFSGSPLRLRPGLNIGYRF